MDLKTFVKRYSGHKVIYKSKAVIPSNVSPPASGHQRAALKSLVLSHRIPYKDIAYKALGYYVYEYELTHDQAVQMIRTGNAMYKLRTGRTI